MAIDDRAPDLADSAPEKPKRKWRQALITLAATLGYMIPLFWLWTDIRWPESFGITIAARGRVGLFENWYYSYLLLKRPNLIDDFTFLYMWAPVVGFLAWIGWGLYTGRARNGGGNTPS